MQQSAAEIENKKRPVLVLTGPTAVGKTKLSLELARAVQGSIISADSMQVYRHMDIGSAKIRPEEMQGIPHYLIDVLEPSEEFNVATFQAMAREAMVRKVNMVPMVFLISSRSPEPTSRAMIT